jgi:hypothetical protein
VGRRSERLQQEFEVAMPKRPPAFGSGQIDERHHLENQNDVRRADVAPESSGALCSTV